MAVKRFIEKIQVLSTGVILILVLVVIWPELEKIRDKNN